MGFDKRYLDTDSVLRVYNRDGIEGVLEYYSNPDALIFMDDFSSILNDCLYNGFLDLAEKKIKKELTIRS